LIEKNPELKGLTMRYEDGGKVQVFTLGDKEARVGPMAADHEIVAAIKERNQ
jgi:hypothetical protein